MEDSLAEQGSAHSQNAVLPVLGWPHGRSYSPEHTSCFHSADNMQPHIRTVRSLSAQ